ncbi:MAG TPA: peptidylprolyl isomerase [Acidimicrobiales bacterium]|nr:peptidylprolyl isomerase [Acidimicrobiales bacterium]
MSSGKRRRQEANQRRVELAEAERRRELRNRRLIVGGGWLVAVVVLVTMAVLLVTHHRSSSGSTTAATVRPTTPSDFGSTPCPSVAGDSPRTIHFTSAPRLCIDVTKQYVATFHTTVGDFAADLDPSKAPVTVNNFVVLALYHYYDGTVFHRAIPGYVVQGGDADGKPPGSGNPGYTIADEFPASLSDYTVGSLAMANRDVPHSGASQFFVWLGPDQLPGPSYSLFGKVISGLDVVRRIEATGSPSGSVDHPVEIKSVSMGSAQIVSR